tara:strand:+ start:116436 stop:117362 length:927 start_codon:yes stop_codon:yes gene_type:complete
MHINRPFRHTVWLVLLLVLGFGCCGWIFWQIITNELRYFVDSSGKPFTVIHLTSTADANLQEMPENSVALSTEGSIVAVKMANVSGDVVSRVWRTPSITSIWMRHCRLPEDVLSSPPFLQELVSHDCSMADRTLLEISKPETLKLLVLMNEELLTASTISKVVDRHHLRHLSLWNIPSLESEHFTVGESSMTQLTSLYLVGDTIDDEVLRQLATGGNLRVLFIYNSDISDGAVADALQSNPKLAELVFTDCPLSIDTLLKAKTLNDLRLLTASHSPADLDQARRLRSELQQRHPEAQITLFSAKNQKK